MGFSRTGRIPALLSVLALAGAVTATGCARGLLPVSEPRIPPAASGAGHRDATVSHSPPVVHAVARKLGMGFIYLTAGPDQGNQNVWVIHHGSERQLTFRSKKNGVTSAGAAAAGIVVSDDQFNADDLGKVTVRGIWWLPTGRPARLHQGSSATISASGQIAFIAVPDAVGYRDSKNFELRIQDSFTSKSRVIYASPTPLSDPVFGPRHQIAFIRQPKASDYASTTVMLRSADGHVHSVRTGLANAQSLVWSANAPDLVVATWPLKAVAIGRNGSRIRLPDGWFPMCWNPLGSRLLVASETKIGFWKPGRPATVRVIGPLSPGMVVGTATWLKHRASLSVP